MTNPNRTSRRGALGRMLLGAGALVGVGAGGVAAARARGGEPTGTPAPAPRPTALTLHARALRHAPAHRDPREAGHREDAPFGELLDDRLRPVGGFRAAPVASGSLHTFTLPDGQLFGLGAGGLEGTAHAVVGGTGRYAGASGSYTIHPAPRLPGRSVTFTLILTAPEA